SLLGVDLEQLVHVAEAGRANRYPVFEVQKGATGAGACQYGRTNGGQVFLSRSPRNPGAGNTREQFIGMRGADERNLVAVDPADAENRLGDRFGISVAGNGNRLKYCGRHVGVDAQWKKEQWKKASERHSGHTFVMRNPSVKG